MRPETPAISAYGLSVVRGEVRILDDVNLTVARGEKLLIAGENGAGKTTFLKALLGLVEVTSGSVTVLGYGVGSREWRTRKRQIGYVNQESVQVDFPISAQEVVEIGMATRRIGRRSMRTKALEAMSQTGTQKLAARDYRVLSGGEKQRVSIARCLAQEADVLLLDEPGAFLDSTSRAEVISVIDRLNERSRISVVLVTHQPEEVASDGWRRVRLADGTLSGVEKV
jgi:zinc transport system ATP-binding protein